MSAFDDSGRTPQYDCVTCGKPIIQSGTPIPGTDVLGYFRDCEACREADLAREDS